MADTLFYDSKCPLCRREIATLTRLAGPGLVFADIHSAHHPGVPDVDTLLRNLHLQRDSGEFVVGLEANVAAWQHTSFGMVWRVLLLWPVRPLAEIAYKYWAERRYRRLYACAIHTGRSR